MVLLCVIPSSGLSDAHAGFLSNLAPSQQPILQLLSVSCGALSSKGTRWSLCITTSLSIPLKHLRHKLSILHRAFLKIVLRTIYGAPLRPTNV
jgi:hypothetical protein